MKLQMLQILQSVIECRNMVGGALVHISKHSLFRLKITVGCRLCAYPSIRVCGVWYVWCEGGVCMCMCMCMCMCRVLCVCVEMVVRVCWECVWCVRMCGMCVLCFGVWCVWCVVCVGVCVGVVSVVSVGGAAWHAENPVCRFKNASVCTGNTRTCWNTRARVAGTHGSVSNVHTEAFWTYTRSVSLSFLSLLSLFLSLSSFLFLRSLPSFSFLSSLFSSLSVTMTMISRPVGSLCVRTALTCPKGQSAWTLAHSLLAEHVRSMQQTTVLVFPVKASCHLEWSGLLSVMEMGVVFGGV